MRCRSLTIEYTGMQEVILHWLKIHQLFSFFLTVSLTLSTKMDARNVNIEKHYGDVHHAVPGTTKKITGTMTTKDGDFTYRHRYLPMNHLFFVPT